MTDHELLELAAKAAGYEKDWHWNHHFIMSAGGSVKDNNSWITWNPLTDDGDALRLAVKLKMAVEVSNRKLVWVSSECHQHTTEIKFNNDDPYAATRRAIVRAAAEIGKGM